MGREAGGRCVGVVAAAYAKGAARCCWEHRGGRERLPRVGLVTDLGPCLGARVWGRVAYRGRVLC